MEHRNKRKAERNIEALKESERLYRAIAETVPVGVMLEDLSGRSIYVNELMQKMTGYTDEELRKAHWITDPEDAEARRLFESAVTEGTAGTDHETRLVRKDGKLIPVSISWSPIRAGDGTLIGVNTTFTDSTERVAAVKALRASERWYKRLVESIPGAVIRVLLRGDWSIDFASEAILSITGYPVEHFVYQGGPAYLNLIHPEDRDHLVASVLTALKERRPFDLEFRILHCDGSIRFCRGRGQGRRDSEGRLGWVDSVVFDVTEVREAERALREAEDRYRLLAENASDLIWQMDLDGRFTYVSPAVRQYGYEPEEWVGQRLPRFLPPHEQALYAARQAGDLAAPRPACYEVQMLAKDGSLVWMEVLVDFVFQDGLPVLLQGIARDITERRESEEALRIVHADLEKAYKVQQEFLNNVTHEIRTPMTAVKGYVEILLEGMAGPLSEVQAGMLRKVLTSSDSLIELVTNLLEVARLRSGGVGLRPTACKPGEVAEKAVAAVTAQAARKGLSIDLWVVGGDRIGVYDEQKLTMILTNLLSNAVKFTRRGGAKVTVTPRPSGVEIIVADSGMGIRRADLPTVFDEFQQLDYPSKYKPSGFGLGLAIVAGAVESIGACLVASSRRGVGTAFTLWVPCLEA